jgi:hypothetical protein
VSASDAADIDAFVAPLEVSRLFQVTAPQGRQCRVFISMPQAGSTRYGIAKKISVRPE